MKFKTAGHYRIDCTEAAEGLEEGNVGTRETSQQTLPDTWGRERRECLHPGGVRIKLI